MVFQLCCRRRTRLVSTREHRLFCRGRDVSRLVHGSSRREVRFVEVRLRALGRAALVRLGLASLYFRADPISVFILYYE